MSIAAQTTMAGWLDLRLGSSKSLLSIHINVYDLYRVPVLPRLGGGMASKRVDVFTRMNLLGLMNRLKSKEKQTAMKLRSRKALSTDSSADKTASKSTKKQKTSSETAKKANEYVEGDFSFFDSVQDPNRKKDFLELHKIIRKVAPDLEPTTEFQTGLIGYGKYHYKYKSGREGDWVKINLANNKQAMALHCCGLLEDGRHVVESMKDRLGKCSAGKSCVRFQKLSDLHRPALEELIRTMATCAILQ